MDVLNYIITASIFKYCTCKIMFTYLHMHCDKVYIPMHLRSKKGVNAGIRKQEMPQLELITTAMNAMPSEGERWLGRDVSPEKRDSTFVLL